MTYPDTKDIAIRDLEYIAGCRMILEQVVFQFRELRYCDFDGRRKNGYSFRCILNVFI